MVVRDISTKLPAKMAAVNISALLVSLMTRGVGIMKDGTHDGSFNVSFF